MAVEAARVSRATLPIIPRGDAARGHLRPQLLMGMAGATGLEPAASSVTG